MGIAGVPASGKSTLSHLLTERINHLLDGRSQSTPSAHSAEADNRQALDSVPSVPANNAHLRDQAILVGLDGWHLSRAQLDLFPDPKQAHDRRGIHWTFDATSYVDFVRKLHNTATVDIVTAPSFDHALKDPTPDAVTVHTHHRIVIIEGLYTFLAVQPWSEAGLLLDERWLVDVDPVRARRRLVERHVLTGVTKDAKEAEWRADTNDGPSESRPQYSARFLILFLADGQFIISNILEPTRIIRSTDIPALSNERMEAAVEAVDNAST